MPNTVPLNFWLNLLGYYGPVILLICVFLVLLSWDRLTIPVFCAVIAWQTLSYYSNVALKNYWQAPRPVGQVLLPASGPERGYFLKHKYYGMPSGHVQGVFSQFGFLALFLQNQGLTFGPRLGLTLLFAFFALLTAWQRYVDRRHTVEQIVVGALVGLGFGYAFYLFLV